MKNVSFLYLLIISIIIFSCSRNQVNIDTNFDHGSLGQMKEISPGVFQGNTKHWLKRDSIGNQYYWFYFKAEKVKNKTISYEMNDLVGVYRGNQHIVFTDYTQPVYSYDQQTWARITDVAYDSAAHSFQFSHKFENESVWIAFAQPYPYHRIEAFAASFKNNPSVNIKSIAKTKEGRNIYMFSIGNTSLQNKKNLLITALQHAGEDAGGFFAEGMIRFLLSDDPEALKARENFNYHIIPMMNPDGIFNGVSRYNMDMEDLNNIWTDTTKSEPEVTGVKKWVDSWTKSGNKIDLFVDLHNHTQFYTYNVFIFEDHSLDSLSEIMNMHWPVRTWHSEFSGSSCSYFVNKGIPSGTIELTQSHTGDLKYLNIEDYFSFGKGFVIGINQYYEK